jgi:beta-1,3-N-acetylgalactosaminyltransferase 2
VQEEYDAKVKEEQKALTREEAEHPDLILVDMIDAYRNLPRKLKESYRWALANTGAAWFMKADDDQYIRVGKTTDYFRQLGRFRND